MPQAIGEYKTCSKCKEQKHISEFSRRSKNLDGLDFRCHSCNKTTADLNRDKLRELDKKSYYKNREKRIAKSKKYNLLKLGKVVPEVILNLLTKKPVMDLETAREVEKSRLRTYKQNHKDLVREQNRLYIQTEKGKQVSRLKTSRYRTRKRNSKVDFSEKEFQFLVWFQKGKCGCCHKEFSPENKPEIDHIIPVSMGGDLTLDNTQLLCRSCNASKSNKTIRYISEISSNHIEEWRSL